MGEQEREEPAVVLAWHRAVVDRDAGAMLDLLAEDAVYHSPAGFAPQEGRDQAYAHISALLRVLGPAFRYVRTWVEADGAVLEFKALVGEQEVHGVELLEWDAEGLITHVSTMIRPTTPIDPILTGMRAELLMG
jgi:hypothetical protein